MSLAEIKIYLCYEPESRVHARRIDGWTRTDPPADLHDRRGSSRPDDPAAAPLCAAVRAGIEAADLAVCLISQTAAIDPWIAWEIDAVRGSASYKPCVGVLLHEFNVRPPAMLNCGAVFVAFRRDLVDRAIRWAHETRATEDDFTFKDF